MPLDLWSEVRDFKVYIGVNLFVWESFGSCGLVLGWVRHFCVRSGFGDVVMEDSPSDIMFFHSGIFPGL